MIMYDYLWYMYEVVWCVMTSNDAYIHMMSIWYVWCMTLHEYLMIHMVYDVRMLLIWMTCMTLYEYLMIHLLYDECMQRNSNDWLWDVYETVHPYDVECGSYATEYPYDVCMQICMQHLNEWVWNINIWLRMMSNDMSSKWTSGRNHPSFGKKTTLLPCSQGSRHGLRDSTVHVLTSW